MIPEGRGYATRLDSRSGLPGNQLPCPLPYSSSGCSQTAHPGVMLLMTELSSSHT